MKTLCKLTSINKKTNAFKTVSKSCIMEGSETTEVSIPVKPVTEVIITHKNHWNREKRLVEEFMNSAMFISTNSNLMSIEEWHDAKADVTSSLIYWIYFNKTLNCYVEGCLKNLIHLAVYQNHLKMITVNNHYRKYVKLTFQAQYSRPLRSCNIGESGAIKSAWMKYVNEKILVDPIGMHFSYLINHLRVLFKIYTHFKETKRIRSS